MGRSKVYAPLVLVVILAVCLICYRISSYRPPTLSEQEKARVTEMKQELCAVERGDLVCVDSMWYRVVQNNTKNSNGILGNDYYAYVRLDFGVGTPPFDLYLYDVKRVDQVVTWERNPPIVFAETARKFLKQ